MYRFSKEYFFRKDSEEKEQNEANYLAVLEKCGGNSDRARDKYIRFLSEEVGEMGDFAYSITHSLGVGDGAKCVELNSTVCNLMHFMGLETYLISGYMQNNRGLAHTFALYRAEETKQFCLVDAALQNVAMRVLPANQNLAKKFSFSVEKRNDDGTRTRYTYCSPCVDVEHRNDNEQER